MRLKTLLSDMAASSVNQASSAVLTGGYFIYAGSLLPKSDFGLYGFYFAATGVVAELLTFGTTSVLVRQIAGQAGRPAIIAGNALLQRTLFPIVFAAISLPFLLSFWTQVEAPSLLVLAFASWSAAHIATVWRQTLIATQKFWFSTASAQIGMISKIAVGLVLVLLGYGAKSLFIALLVSSVIEATASFLLLRRVAGTWFTPCFNRTIWWNLLQEGWPLMLALLLNQSLARADWILMGALSTSEKTGEYVFAYRVFELCRLPLTVVSVVALPKLSVALRSGIMTASYRQRLTSFHRLLVSISALLPLCLILMWVPVMDAITSAKYGQTNLYVVCFLSAGVPFMAGINVMWSLAMAQRRQKVIMVAILIASVTNIAMDLVLIPRFGGVGAAVATTVPMGLQYVCYCVFMGSALRLWSILGNWLCVATGVCVALFGAMHVSSSWPVQVMLALALYSIIMLAGRGIRREDVLQVIGRTSRPD